MGRRPAPEWVSRESVSRYGLTTPERTVLLCLWDHADKHGLTFPSQPTIARETGYGQTTTKAATSVLHRRGFIRRADGLGPDDAVPHDRKAVRWVVESTPAWVDRRLVRQAT